MRRSSASGTAYGRLRLVDTTTNTVVWKDSVVVGTTNVNYSSSIGIIPAGVYRFEIERRNNAATQFFIDNVLLAYVDTSTVVDCEGGRKDYRYGFNGQEKDDEIKGEGNSYTTEFRQYDPRLGRWLTLDPIFKPWESQYATFANNPILITDPYGLDGNNSNTQKSPPQGDEEEVVRRKAEAKIRNLKEIISQLEKKQAGMIKKMNALFDEAMTNKKKHDQTTVKLWKAILSNKPKSLLDYYVKKRNELHLEVKKKFEAWWDMHLKVNELNGKIWDYQNQLDLAYSQVPIKVNEPVGGGSETDEGSYGGSMNPETSDESWGSGGGGSTSKPPNKKDQSNTVVHKPIFKKGYGNESTDYYEVHHVTTVVKDGKEQTFDTVYFYNAKTKKFITKERYYNY